MRFMVDGEPVETGGPGDRLLTWDRVQDIAGISRTTAWRMQQVGDFPEPVAISALRVGWWESELTAWKASRKRGVRPPVFKPARAPRLIDTGRSQRRVEVAEPPALAPPPAPQVVEPLPARKPGRRAKGSPDQFDFGF